MNRRSFGRGAIAMLCVSLPACNRDAALAKRVTGLWTWNPRAVLPPEQIKDTAWPTPTLESYRFNADGTYVHVQRIPGAEVGMGKGPVDLIRFRRHPEPLGSAVGVLVHGEESSSEVHA